MTKNLGEAEGFWSTLNILYITGWNFDGGLPPFFFDYSIFKGYFSIDKMIEHFIATTIIRYKLTL